jgi:hypothetical protein
MTGFIFCKEGLLRTMVLIVVLVVFNFLPVTPSVMANPCIGDFDCDTDCDGTDALTFKADFGRGRLFNPCEPCFAALKIPKTGQASSYTTGDDGDLKKGVAWPNPRFTDNLDGTVTDNLTGLIWLKNANCFGRRGWNQAIADCNQLANGSCGLTDDSMAGDWRLPNRYELESLLHLQFSFPPLPNTEGTEQWSEGDPFSNLQIDTYWSSTALADFENSAWNIGMHFGCLNGSNIANGFYVWPLRNNE